MFKWRRSTSKTDLELTVSFLFYSNKIDKVKDLELMFKMHSNLHKITVKELRIFGILLNFLLSKFITHVLIHF